ncbi:MAG: FtsW/RodA/SpoVE family cell cycle protein [Prevotella sp.]|jgi:cell division protein FtsW|nr:FtsW/RodA/SpoVE family cell cycle protein [Prevotella sp.]
MDFFSKTFRGDKVIWAIFAFFCIISLLEIFSATSTLVYKQENQWAPILRHATFLLIGLGGIMFLQRVPTRWFQVLILLLVVSWLLLVCTMLMGKEINGSQRWLGVGAFSIQPSELSKISAVGFMAFLLSRLNKENEDKIFKIIIIAIGFTCFLIVFDNLSTAILLFTVCYLMMFIGQIQWKKLLSVFFVISLFAALFIGGLRSADKDWVRNNLPDRAETWKGRIDRFFDGTKDELYSPAYIADNYQVVHGKMAIANGGLIGLPGSGVERDFLPQAYSDFIFAIILEEMGLAGGIVVLFLYIALMFRVGILARKCDKLFPKYLLLGTGLMLTIQALINMAVAVNLIPVTGQPLPLISRGGTSTIITCVYFGIILACSNIKEEEHEDADESIANVEYE